MRIDVLTLFPEMFPGVLGASILGRAAERGLVDVRVHDIRDWSRDAHRKVDDRPYGGGPGMVLAPGPVVRAVRAVRAMAANEGRLVLLTPQGEFFAQARARALAREERLVLVCGHYEGFDERIRTILSPEELSVGPYVLTGGEPAALVVIDAVARLVPGVLGCAESCRTESFAGENGLLEGPQYTRPREYEGLRVPEVLTGGNHAEIEVWRACEAERRTRERRPGWTRGEDKEGER